jgi:predicted HD phosphohydrolase
MVVACLFHDSAVGIAPANHGQVAAELLRPYVSEETYWVVKHHGVVQKLSMVNHPYWGSGPGEAAVAPLRSNPFFDRTRQFCDDYDGASFDPEYDTLPLEAFEPQLRRVFGREAFRPA